MAQLDTTRSALRNVVRACVVSSAQQAGLLSDYPHGGVELGEVSNVILGVQDSVFHPFGWEFGMPVDHAYRSGQTWVLAMRLRSLQDPDWRKIAFRTTTPTDAYAPAQDTIRADLPGYVPSGISAGSISNGFLLLSPVDLTHDAVVCYAPVRRIKPDPIDWGGARPAEGSIFFTLGRHATIGEPLAVNRLEKLRLS